MQLRHTAVTVAMLGLATAAMAGPRKGRPPLRWASTWKEGVQEAKARHVPVFVLFSMDG